MKYITAIFAPSFDVKYQKGLTPKYYYNATRRVNNLYSKVGLIKHNKSILQDDYIVFVDEYFYLNRNNNLLLPTMEKEGIKYEIVGGLNKTNGLFCPKIEVTLRAMSSLKDAVLWTDFTDAKIKEPLSKEEIEFLYAKPMSFEFEYLRLRGPRMHYKDGRECTRKRQRQPQTAIYFANDKRFIEEVLKNKISHDQVAFGHALEKLYNIYQDSEKKDCLSFSSEGLFWSCSEDSNSCTYAFQDDINRDRRFKAKIFHKCKDEMI